MCVSQLRTRLRDFGHALTALGANGDGGGGDNDEDDCEMSGPPPDERRGTTGSAVAATLTDGQLFSPDIFIAPRAPPEEAMLDDVLFFGVAAPPTPGG